MKRVMAFGTFDQFHLGHEAYLRQAKELGDELVVVVARDETVKKIKGKMPEWSESKRRKGVIQSGIAEIVVLGNIKDKHDVIRKYRPDVIALGYDQFIFTYRLEKLLIEEKINARVVRLKSFHPEVYKTSLLTHSYEPAQPHN